MAAQAKRRCIATGETRDTAQMIRLVESPDGGLVPDVAHKLPGRGYWLTASRAAAERAGDPRGRRARRGAGARGVNPGLADRIEALLAARCLECLGLAKRAGILVGGFDRVEKLLRSGTAAARLAASDGAADGKAKLQALGPDLPVIGLFSVRELSLALGRENVVHAALTAGPLTARFMNEAARLGGFRAVAGGRGDGGETET